MSGSRGHDLGSPMRSFRADEHLAQAVAVAAGCRLQSLAQVVLEHDVPLTEELGRQELGDVAVATSFRRVPDGSGRGRCRGGGRRRWCRRRTGRRIREPSAGATGTDSAGAGAAEAGVVPAEDTPGRRLGPGLHGLRPSIDRRGFRCGQISGSGARVLAAGPSSLVDWGVLVVSGVTMPWETSNSRRASSAIAFSTAISFWISSNPSPEKSAATRTLRGSCRSGPEASARPGRSRSSRRNGIGWRARPSRPRPGSS